ncbi:MAG: VanW family protein [Clostridium perfringens]|nr:VanW family protein [Clostridium perfringens]
MKKEKSKSKKKKRILLLLVLLVIIGTTTTTALGKDTKGDGTLVSQGVYLENTNLSNLTKEALIETLQSYYSNKLGKNTITLTYGEITEVITAADIGIGYDIEKIAEEIISIGRQGNLLENVIDKFFIRLNKKILSYDEKNVDEEKINEYINNLSSLINKEKQEATISFNADTLTAENSQEGLEVDKEVLKEKIIEGLRNEEKGERIEIPVNIVEVNLNESQAQNMTIIGTYETTLPDLTSGRTQNIRLFSSKLNGVVLMPGETISVDEQGGSRELSDGYTAAPGFINNQVVDIVAGGICQVVTTLYNSVVYSDLEIVERAPHSLPVSYAPLGRDATLAKGVIDFKFKNNYENPIIIQAYVTDNCTVKTTIWGVNENPSKVIEIDARQTGSKSSITYKNVYENGILVKSEVLSQDVYN